VRHLGKWLKSYGTDIALGAAATNPLGLTAPGEQITVREIAIDGPGWKRGYVRLVADGGFLFIAVDARGSTSFRADADGKLVSAVRVSKGVGTPIELAGAQTEYRALTDYWGDQVDQSLCPASTTGPSSAPADVLIADCTAVIQSPEATPRILGYAYTHRSAGYAAKGDTVHQAEDLALAAKARAKVR
jgi:hypothetical protein